MTPTSDTPRSPPPAPGEVALRSVHTINLPALLDRLHISLVVSTHQAGDADASFTPRWRPPLSPPWLRRIAATSHRHPRPHPRR